MSKSEWEKRRDAFDYVSALNGQVSVGLHGALGAEARRATEALSRPPPRQKNKATSNIMAGAAASAEASQRVRDLPTWLATVVWIIGFMAMFASTPRRWSTILFASLVLSVPTTAFSDEILARAALLNNEFDMAREIYADLYDEGNPEAAFVLGMMYREGWGVEEDADRARDYLVEARKLGHIEASYWLCRDQFEVATSRAEYDAVADLCMPASAQDRAKTTGGFIYHPHHAALANYVAGKALLKSGSEKTAVLCLTKAYIFIEGHDELRKEEGDIEAILARYSPKWYVGSWEQERPYEGHYLDTDKIPPCMISPIAVSKIIMGNGSPLMKGIFSALGLR